MLRPRLFRPEETAVEHVLTARDVVHLYLRHARATNLHGPAMREEYARILGEFVEDTGPIAVNALKPYHLSDWIDGHATWKSTATRKKAAAIVNAAFAWAARGERIDRNPFRTVSYATAERRPEIPDDTLARMLGLANAAVRPALQFLRLTGCRISEMCNAKWGDVDLERGVWTIGLHKSRKRTKKPKVVALVPAAVSLLRAVASARANHASLGGSVQPGRMAANAPLFLNSRGRPWSRQLFGQNFRRLLRKVGARGFCVHSVRHTFATRAIAAGASPKLIAEQLGHSSVTITERFYVELSGDVEAIRRAAGMGLPPT